MAQHNFHNFVARGLVLLCVGVFCTTTKDCPGGWTKFHNSCYMISSIALNWSAAQINCTQVGSHLVTISFKDENDFVKGKISAQPHYYQHYWIGLYRAPFDNEVWSWIDGTQVTFTDWWRGQPDNYKLEESCGEFYSARVGQVGWNDLNCSKVHHFVCEKELGELPACEENNGGCEHICISTFAGPECRCEDGLISVKKGKLCLDPSAYLTAKPQVAPLVLQVFTLALLIPISCVLVSFYRRVARQRRSSAKARAIMIGPPTCHADESSPDRATSPLVETSSDDVNGSGEAMHV